MDAFGAREPRAEGRSMTMRSAAGAVALLVSFSTLIGAESTYALDNDQQEIVDGFDYLVSEARQRAITDYVRRLGRWIEASCGDDLPPACDTQVDGGLRAVSTTFFGEYTIEMSGPVRESAALTTATDIEISLSAQQNHDIADLPDGMPLLVRLSAGTDDAAPQTRMVVRDDYNEGTEESNVMMIDVSGQGIAISRANVQSGNVSNGEFVAWADLTGRNRDSIEALDARAFQTAQDMLGGLYLDALETGEMPTERSLSSFVSTPLPD